MQNYDSFKDYWLNTSSNVCECCKNNKFLFCEGENCSTYYKLTEEECKEKGLTLDIIWTCVNTDDFEFCNKVQNSPCAACIRSDNFSCFDHNGLIF